MDVGIKDLTVDMPVGRKGLELDVYDGEEHLGDLRIGKATIEWCPGKVHQGNGSQKSWKELIAWFMKDWPKRNK